MDKKSLILTIIGIFLFGLYLPLDSARADVYSFKTIVDDWIPLWTPFLSIYISYFVFLVLTLVYFLRSKKPVITNTLLLSVVLACVISYIFYLLFQNSVDRPQIKPVHLFDDLYLWVNEQVPPYNAFPSLHVAVSIICSIGYFVINSKYKYLMAIWAGLIIVSTVVTKQHYFLDIIGGLFLAVGCYKISKLFFKTKS